MDSQFKIFYSWQSDNKESRKAIENALGKVVKDLNQQGLSVEIVMGGGGNGFVSIEDAVRMKIEASDIFIGDVTPVGNVSLKDKLLPNANVMYEMGIATESLNAKRIIAVALRGDWLLEKLPFDFNHYSMVLFENEKGLERLAKAVKACIIETAEVTKRVNSRFFSDTLLKKNIAIRKYLPDVYVEDKDAKHAVRCFVAPAKMYGYIYDKIAKYDFSYYQKQCTMRGETSSFEMGDLNAYSLQNKAFDLQMLRDCVNSLTAHLTKKEEILSSTDRGWQQAFKLRNSLRELKMLNQLVMLVTSNAGQGKTNFLCDVVNNLLLKESIPFVYVNAYELSAEYLAQSIAFEYNYIGNGSLEDVLDEVAKYCKQQNQYFIIIIDGLNEHPRLGAFRRNLMRVLQAIKHYRHVKVLMTCRTEYYTANFNNAFSVLGDDLLTKNLGGRQSVYDDEDVDSSLVERYMKQFNVVGHISPSIVKSYFANKLLMRIFFEVNKDKDISKVNQIGRDKVYQQYFEMSCANLQHQFNEGSALSVKQDTAKSIFRKINSWMLEHSVFKNIPTNEIQKCLSNEELNCFPVFINSNLFLQQDYNSQQDVMNFTFEDIRDYILTDYILQDRNIDSIDELHTIIENLSQKESNMAEGVAKFTFLMAHNREMKNVLDMLLSFEWYKDACVNYIWYVDDDKVLPHDIEIIKRAVSEQPNMVVPELTTIHWNPTKFSNINIRVFLEAWKEMTNEDKEKIADEVWPEKKVRRTYFEDNVLTSRVKIINFIEKAILHFRHQEETEQADVLYQFLMCFVELEKLKKDDSVYAQRVKEYIDQNIEVEEQQEEKTEVSFVRYCTEPYQYLLLTTFPSNDSFVKQVGAEKGYAKEMFSDIHDAIFKESRDVKDDYEKYYSHEYESFEKFLSSHYHIKDKHVDYIMKTLKEDSHKHLMEFSTIEYGMSQLEDFVFSDDMCERFEDLLR